MVLVKKNDLTPLFSQYLDAMKRYGALILSMKFGSCSTLRISHGSTPEWTIFEEHSHISYSTWRINSSFQFHSCALGFSCSWAPNIWYVTLSWNQTTFYDFVAIHIIDHEYYNEYHGNVRQTVAMNNLLFNPGLLTTTHLHIAVRRFVPHECDFAILAPKVYHGGLNTGYDVAKSTNFPDHS